MSTVVSRANVALVKYWGKRDAGLNLPEAGSISLTLDALQTRTEVALDPKAGEDLVTIDGVVAAGRARERVVGFLDLIRPKDALRARVVSRSNFPASAGLASSSSAFSALAVAGTSAYGVALAPRGLSALARRGSGSAARSIFGGFVEMYAGDDHETAHAAPLMGPGEWDLVMVLGIVGHGPKAVGSTRAMTQSRDTSPLHGGWIASVERDLPVARDAIAAQDLATLGEVMERSCLTMHADCMAALPGVLFWRGPTIEGFHAIRDLRSGGTPVWFTNDAGPHVKALTSAAHGARVAECLAALPGIDEVRVSRPGPSVEFLP